MNEPFILEVICKNTPHEFPAAFQRYGYVPHCGFELPGVGCAGWCGNGCGFVKSDFRKVGAVTVNSL